ncbi:MAG: BREX system P-loop protein BrxC [Bacteroidales bacterium]|nr:BREX system P-loop protein BrxC [Bacteroidales bacterium]
MKQQEIYAKDINREINGVIKASSTNDLATEIKEYIITAEQMRQLPRIFESLSQPNKSTFAWIAGDFGSGKSHLLKILSYVLENETKVDGKTFGQYLAEKAEKDFELSASIVRACRIPTRCALFNIQDSLDGVGKKSVDPVLHIFLKEFNRKLGYDEKKPAIAEIERYFDNKGKLQWFHEEYQRRFGKAWEADRPSILMKQQNIAVILADLDGTSVEVALQNIKTQIDNYSLDPNGFVKLVKEYLDNQPSDTRFIFFIDEVGQFIGTDEHRMLSLQTIAEGLADRTDGRAMIIVTSQMDIDAALGHLEKTQQNDFSRIQGRFTTRLSLTSANADEVIQRRLLEKKSEPQHALCEIYDRERNIIRTLFNFGDNSQFKTDYKSREQFAIDFPFVDYQFDLLQKSIIELSKNNAFTGRQQSVGERSMLTITQEVAKVYQDKGLDEIVQFSDMYEGLRSILQTRIQSDIIQAERTLGDNLALKVLKVLFLVKYVKGFPSTLDNITRLLLPAINADFIELRTQVEEALKKLVRASYIEKAANDEYHYQTNEEKDIENEIKAEELSPDAINNELKKIFRDEIFTDTKIKLTNAKIFSFGRYVDEQQDGRESELYINFVTPLTGLPSTDPEAMTAYSLQHPNHLCVVLGDDKALAEDISMYKKAEKCLTRLLSSASDYRQQIVTDKRRINSRRRENIVDRLSELTKDARLYIFGNEIRDIRYTDIRTRLGEAMKRLVEMVYIHLSMLTVEYTDQTLKDILNATSAGTLPFGGDMDACCTEVYTKIVRDKNLSVRSKVKDIVDTFRKPQYGWHEMATLCILAKLYKLDKISFRMNGAPVEGRHLLTALTNSQQQAQLIVDVEQAIAASQVNRLKEKYKDFFDRENCTTQGAKDVHSAFSKRLKDEAAALRSIRDRHHYEFTKPIAAIVADMQKLADMPYPGLYLSGDKLESLLDDIEDSVIPIRDFVNGPQLDIFAKVVNYKTGNTANLTYVSQELRDTLDEAYTSAAPWRLMTKAKQAIDDIAREIGEKQEEARSAVAALIDQKIESLSSLPVWPTLKDNQRQQILAMMESQRNRISGERFIGNLKTMASEVNRIYDNAIDLTNRWIEESEPATPPSVPPTTIVVEPSSSSSSSQTPPQPPVPPRPIRKSINKKKAMNVQFSKPYLENSQDVEDYISALRTQLLDYINRNTNVLLND